MNIKLIDLLLLNMVEHYFSYIPDNKMYSKQQIISYVKHGMIGLYGKCPDWH